jgi:MoaA/NifB/PqqE/SkfB family radical SAM enzyme
MSAYGIDGHKLHLHPQRVAAWMNGENIYPVYMEIAPAGACNHRCVFCTMDFMGYKAKFLDTAIMCRRLRECGALGVKAVMFAGEGEPLLHKDIAVLAATAKEAGMDVSFTTNAVLLGPETARRLLPVSSWIKVSCNAGAPETYAAIHRTAAGDFEKVMGNMETAARIRQQEGHACTLGLQCILLPENAAHMPALARRARDLGADYLVIKPYTHSPKSLSDHYGNISYADCEELGETLRLEEREGFTIIFRHEAMRRWDAKKSAFDRCLALPFWVYVDAEANVWGCLRHLQEEAFHYGNLAEQTFARVWTGEKRRDKVARCEEFMDVSRCHVTCRMEAINEYLWRLRHPEAHDNFI